MITSNLQKKAEKFERLAKAARKALVEFKIAKSQWEIKNGKYKAYSSAKEAMRDIRKLAA